MRVSLSALTCLSDPGAARNSSPLRARPRLPRVGERRQDAGELLAQVLEVRRKREPLAERLPRLVGREARPERRDLEEHAARLAEVDRLEVEAVDDRRRPTSGPLNLLAP